eukprot:TRINITY_DN34030_c0_g1_i1.p1 TRINITY_DN34030_c0_g1~~TRINITY_DN34030_c0_g1_i1.p1  ORF type:complete len:187 (-),score=24.00 TRINITY_DN34030_c0_g1_i1:109-669(-)
MGLTSSSDARVPVGPPTLTPEELAARAAAVFLEPPAGSGASVQRPRIRFLNRTTWPCQVEVSCGRTSAGQALRVHLSELPARRGTGEPFVPADASAPWRVRFVSTEARDGPQRCVLDQLDSVTCESGDVRITLSEVPGGAEIARIEYLGPCASGLDALPGSGSARGAVLAEERLDADAGAGEAASR